MQVTNNGKSLAELLDSSISMSSDSADDYLILNFSLHSLSKAKIAWENNPEDDLKLFQYAVLLSKSSSKCDREESKQYLTGLMHRQGYASEAMYHLALVLYSLNSYEEARVCAEELYCQEPDSAQIRNLHGAIAYKHQLSLKTQEKQQTIGIALGVGVAALAIGVALVLQKKK
eukprot:gene11819-15817_t